MTPDQTTTLWLGAFRYYCGRMTYAVGDFCELLIKEWSGLPERTKNLIRRDQCANAGIHRAAEGRPVE